MSDPKDSPFSKLAALRDTLPAGAPASAPKEKPAPKLFGEKVVVRHTRKGHGGKTVTVVTGVLPHALEPMCGELKRAMGCGARVEDGGIVLQGDLVDRAIAWLDNKGAKKIVKGS
jgi:translation initiation factor 1